MEYCTIDGCKRAIIYKKHGLCSTHLKRKQVHGNPHMTLIPRHPAVKGPEHQAWANMIQRCTNPNNRAYKWYGARGITVCERWRYSFSAFYEDMGKRTSNLHSLERVNNNGNYEPSNCVWATWLEQNNNRRPISRSAK